MTPGSPSRLSLALAFTFLVAGCFGTPAGGPQPRKSPGLRSTGTPSPALSSPSPTSGRAARNVAPREGTRLLEASIQADAGWVVANGGGAIVSSNGASVLRLGAALISDNGLGVVSNNGGNVVVADGERLMTAGGTLLSDNGLGLVGKAKLLGNNGAGIVANNGGGIVSNNGSGYRLAQADAALGTALPAAQMVVGVIDPRSGAPVPVGVDEAGDPVFAVFSDGAGRVRLHVPETLAGNLRLVALPPDGSDARLRVSVLAAARGGEARVDDAEVQATALCRHAMARRLADLYAGSGAEALIPASAAARNPGLAAFAAPVAKRLKEALDEVGGRTAAPLRIEAVALLATDRMIADLDLEAMPLEAGLSRGYEPAAGERVMATIRAVSARIAEAAAARLREDPRWFEARPYVIEANRLRKARGLASVEVRKPSDLASLLFLEFLASDENALNARVGAVFADLGIPQIEGSRVRAAAASLSLAVGTQLLTGTDSAGTPVLDLVEQLVQRQGPVILAASDTSPPSGPEAYPPAPPAETGDVITIAGGSAGFADGAGATARFNAPMGLALDGQGRLYVADRDNSRLRAIDLRDPAHPVTTVAGGGGALSGDVPALTADLAGVSGLVVAPGGVIYASTGNTHRIWRIAPAPAGAVARLVAGAQEPAPTDGSPPGDRINFPFRLALGADGALYFTERKAGRLRRLRDDGSGRVETLFDGIEGPDFLAGLAPDAPPIETRVFPRILGPVASARVSVITALAIDPLGQMAFAELGTCAVLRLRRDQVIDVLAGGIINRSPADAFWMGAGFREPSDFVFGPGGQLYLTDVYNHRVRVVLPPGDVRTVAGGAPDAPTEALVGGFADGPAATARFNQPEGIALDADGTIYVADTANHRIRAIRPKK